VLCFYVDSVVDVVVDSNHVDVADVHAYVDNGLASPDSDRLHLPVVADATRTAGLYICYGFPSSSFGQIKKHF